MRISLSPVLLREEGHRFSQEPVLLLQFPDPPLQFLQPGALGHRQLCIGPRVSLPIVPHPIPDRLAGYPAIAGHVVDCPGLFDDFPGRGFPELGTEMPRLLLCHKQLRSVTPILLWGTVREPSGTSKPATPSAYA